MAIHVIIMPSAEKDLRALDPTIARRVADKLRAIVSEGPGCRQCQAADGKVAALSAAGWPLSRIVHDGRRYNEGLPDRPSTGGLRKKRKETQILEHEGKPAYVVLPIEDYQAMRDRLEDLEDLALLRQAELADKGKPGRPLEDVLKELGLNGK